MSRNGSGMWEGSGSGWTQESVVREREEGDGGSGGEATVIGEGEDVRVDEEADVDSSIGDAEADEEALHRDMMSTDEVCSSVIVLSD
jgi:hypothetical protein